MDAADEDEPLDMTEGEVGIPDFPLDGEDEDLEKDRN